MIDLNKQKNVDRIDRVFEAFCLNITTTDKYEILKSFGIIPNEEKES